MKRLLFLAAALCMLASCSSDSDESSREPEPTTVTFTFSPYDVEPMTRASISIADMVTHLDVWISDETTTTDLHQTSSDSNFGSLSVTLDKTKTYTLTAVAHKCTGNATLTDGIIAFPDDNVTLSMVYTTEFTPATSTTLNCLMTRIVGLFRLEVADVIPDEVYIMTFDFGDCFTRWDVNTSTGENAAPRSKSFVNFSRNDEGKANFTFHFIPTDLISTDTYDVTVTALRQNNSVIKSRTFTGVPIKAGYRTTYHGQFFTDQSVSASFAVEDWNDFNAVNF